MLERRLASGKGYGTMDVPSTQRLARRCNSSEPKLPHSTHTINLRLNTKNLVVVSVRVRQHLLNVCQQWMEECPESFSLTKHLGSHVCLCEISCVSQSLKHANLISMKCICGESKIEFEACKIDFVASEYKFEAGIKMGQTYAVSGVNQPASFALRRNDEKMCELDFEAQIFWGGFVP